MQDTRFLKIGEDCAVATDSLQWIIQRYRSPKWRSESFIAQYKVVLERHLGLISAEKDSDARRALDQLCPTFRQWKNEQATDLGKDWVRILGKRFDESLSPDDKARNGKQLRKEAA